LQGQVCFEKLGIILYFAFRFQGKHVLESLVSISWYRDVRRYAEQNGYNTRKHTDQKWDRRRPNSRHDDSLDHPQRVSSDSDSSPSPKRHRSYSRGGSSEVNIDLISIDQESVSEQQSSPSP
jgi:hypothetical protein